MPEQSRRRVTRHINFLLLTGVALASMGTLTPDYGSGNARTSLDWSGDPARLDLQIRPSEGRVPDFDESRFHWLAVTIPEVAASVAENARWKLGVDGKESYWTEGAFTLRNPFTEYTEANGQDSTGPRNYGDLGVDVGPFCPPDSSEDEACIPCDLAAGCLLHVHVALCSTESLQPLRIQMEVYPEDGEYAVRCPDGESQIDCDRLDSWLHLTYGASEPEWCESSRPGMDDSGRK